MGARVKLQATRCRPLRAVDFGHFWRSKGKPTRPRGNAGSKGGKLKLKG